MLDEPLLRCQFVRLHVRNLKDFDDRTRSNRINILAERLVEAAPRRADSADAVAVRSVSLSRCAKARSSRRSVRATT
jgi:hypothetical protein